MSQKPALAVGTGFGNLFLLPRVLNKTTIATIGATIIAAKVPIPIGSGPGGI